MTRKHLFLYDILLPGALIVGAGWLGSQLFAEKLLWVLDHVRMWDLGTAFRKSEIREWVWNYSDFVFAVPPALLWLLWVRLNVQTDFLSGRKSLERPLFQFVHGFFNWIEDGGELAAQKRDYELKLARAHDKIHQLQIEMSRAQSFQEDVESQLGDLDFHR